MVLEKIPKGIKKGLEVLAATTVLSFGAAGTVSAQEAPARVFTSINPFSPVQNEFIAGQPIVIVDIDPYSRPGDLYQINVYGPAGNLVSASSMPVRSFGERWDVYGNTQALAQMGGFGNYRAIVSDNGQVVGEADFEIFPPQPQIVPVPQYTPHQRFPHREFAPPRQFYPPRPFIPQRRFNPYDHGRRGR